eukprot:TRINITY_DN4984_c0_g2_i1.p2 TRINITY_DN4984_c0_g2~~TRINITY_DN4984_c0_g2_i1.p2  ORF type:complete len:205 (+),score=-2.53 TRINITY_DN4984_c0_g2_i1:473-1087(+)
MICKAAIFLKFTLQISNISTIFRLNQDSLEIDAQVLCTTTSTKQKVCTTSTKQKLCTTQQKNEILLTVSIKQTAIYCFKAKVKEKIRYKNCVHIHICISQFLCLLEKKVQRKTRLETTSNQQLLPSKTTASTPTTSIYLDTTKHRQVLKMLQITIVTSQGNIEVCSASVKSMCFEILQRNLQDLQVHNLFASLQCFGKELQSFL